MTWIKQTDTKQYKDYWRNKDYNISLYRRVQRGKVELFYQAQFWIQGARIRKSTELEDLKEAQTKALELYFLDKGASDRGYDPSPFKMEQAIKMYQDWIDAEIKLWKDSGEKPKIGYTDRRGGEYKRLVNRYHLGYFKGTKLAEIDNARMADYWKWRREYWLSGPGATILADPKKKKAEKLFGKFGVPGQQSLNVEGQIFAKIFELAVDAKKIKKEGIPKTTAPTIGVETIKHPPFSYQEYTDLMQWLIDRASKTYAKDNQDYGAKRWLSMIDFAFYSGLDPAEIVNLKIKNITRVDATPPYYKGNCVGKRTKGKGIDKPRPFVVMDEATQQIDAWLAYTPYNKPDDYLFPSYGGEKFNNASTMFNRLLEEYGHTNSSDEGTPLVLYSCRHSYATFQIKYKNIDWNWLATQMGHKDTSMLHHHYAGVQPEDYVAQLNKPFRSKQQVAEEIMLEVQRVVQDSSSRKLTTNKR